MEIWSQAGLLVLLTTLRLTDAQTSECQQATRADIAFLVDSSSSISTKQFQQMKDFTLTLISNLDVGSNQIRVGMAQYSDDTFQEFLFNQYSLKKDILDHIQNMEFRAGTTYTGSALDFIRERYFMASAGSRIEENVPQIVILLTDGESIDEVKVPASKLKEKGISVYVVGIGVQDITQLMEIASWPFNEFVFSIDSFDALQNLTSSLLSTVCFAVKTQIEDIQKQYADVIFLVDSSEPMGPSDFEKVKTLTTNIVERLDVGMQKYRIGFAQYGGEGRMEFLLNSYDRKEDVLNHIRNSMEFRGGPLDTESALQFLTDLYFTEEAGSRLKEGIPQFVVIVTSQTSRDDINELTEKLKETGVKALTVDVLTSDITDVFSAPRSENGDLTVQSVDDLHENIVGVLDTSLLQQYNEALEAEVPAACTSASMADIAFLVDKSDSIGSNNFRLIKTFLLQIINSLDIAPDNVRVALVLYSNKPRLVFNLNAAEKKSEVVNYVKKLPYRGGQTHTGAALDFLRNNVFTKKAGSRKNQGVQQLAVVITDGKSQDNFTRPASLLRQRGVTVFAVGVQKNTDSKQLYKIASHPPQKHVTNTDNFLQLSNIEQMIKKRVCNEILSQAFVIPVRSRNLKEGCEETEKADIYFLIDGSRSISTQEFGTMKVFMKDLIRMFQVGTNKVRFGMVQYSTRQQIEFLITKYSTVAQLEYAIQRITQLDEDTYTGEALRFMKSLFENSARKNVPQILIVITDGEATDTVTAAAQELREGGIIIYAIGVKGANKDELEDIAGTKERRFFVNDYDSLKIIKHDIVEDICSPAVCKNLKADIIFLIDGSKSIKDFDKRKEFMYVIVNGSDIGADKVQIALLQYGTDLKEEFSLDRYDNQNDLRKAISAMKQIKGKPNTGEALSVASSYFSATKGGRSEVKQYLIVVTGGKSSDKVSLPARALRNKGVTIFAIGTHAAEDSLLKEIAGTGDRVFLEDNYESPTFLGKAVSFEICHSEKGCKRTKAADIIFLVHGSRRITDLQFKAIQRLMEAVVNASEVEKDRVQFGSILYSTAPEEQFPLNEYSTRTQVREAISKLRPLSGFTFTATALNFARRRFGADFGGRASLFGITQIIVLITDEPTTPSDRPNLPAALQALQKEGIDLIVIGIDGASRTELEDIVDDPPKQFYAPSYNALDSLHEDITNLICNLSKPVCEAQRADIVFLMDSSESISHDDFSTMKIFMKELVDSFIIGRDKIEIGVAQYSDDPKKEFYLGEHETYVSIKERIDHIIQLRRATFTGKALRFTKSFFEPVNGSRKQKGVPQVLIVITDGESHQDDPVNEAAADLRNEGIQVFAIGVGVANPFELTLIAGDPQRVFKLDSFDKLKINKWKIVKEICEVKDQPSQDCNIDISVGVDISTSMLNLKQRMHTYLPRLLQRIGPVTSISCKPESPVNIRFRYQVFAGNGQSLFDSDFEAYNEEIIQKFMAVQTTVDTYLNVGFLQSFWDQSLSLATAKLKALLVFTDGPDDSLERLKTTVDSLRRKGLDALLMIGLRNIQAHQELQELEFGRGFTYQEPLLIGNPELPSMLWRALDAVAERKCCDVCCKCFGHEGIRGRPGTPGKKGPTGIEGYPGHPGEEGRFGDPGLMGVNGTRGYRGCPGRKGPKGSRGYQGNKGDDGDFGLDGINGEEGDRGSSGSTGRKGSRGCRGREGLRGNLGEQGQPGVRGYNGSPGIDNNVIGSPGEKGSRGQQGEPGADGGFGAAGEKGTNGPDGHRGLPGIKGIQGNDGESGYPGVTGLTGQQGVRGVPGIPGSSGSKGLPGPQGIPGTDGESGSAGKFGPTGQKGEYGDSGEKGLQGPPGPRGLSGLDGHHGYGVRGKKGAKGQSGFPGYPGQQGDNGDQGIQGDKGAKGVRGQRASDGKPGSVGDLGGRGPPGRMGHKGEKGITDLMPCDLVNLSRQNCPCCIGTSQCPLYPTDVVFALDMSGDVTPESFQRMKDIMATMLNRMKISRSNCPTGARVSVLSFNTHTNYLIRFSDFRRDDLLVEAIRRIPLERTSGKRNVGEAMRFVARNVFKRYRHGVLMRKVAVFLTGGPSEDADFINTAVLEFSAFDITPVVIALQEVPHIRQAFLADDTRRSQFYIWESEEVNLDSISRCALCFDKCNSSSECEVVVPTPISINMDITYILDSSRSVGREEFETMKEFVSSMLNLFVISPLPLESDRDARVALVQQAPQNFTENRSSSPVFEEFDLTSYNSKNLMQKHIQESVHQLEGPSAIGHALQWTVNNVFLETPRPRKHRVLFTILGSRTSSWDREKLRQMSLEAKCQGFTMLTLALGRRVDDTEIIELSSVPVEQHLLQLGRVHKLELPYALQFSRAFLNLLKREANPYPPPGLQEECESLDRGDTYQQAIGKTDRIPFPKVAFSDTLQTPAVTRNIMQDNTVTVTQESEDKIYHYVEDEYFTDTKAVKRTENKELLEQVQKRLDICTVDPDSGECEDYTLKWYFNREHHTCSQFWYGSCGGNKNNFETREECEVLCMVPS